MIATVEAPPALGPYAQAVKVDNVVYVSGQLPLDPKTRTMVSGNIAAQTERVLENIRAILDEAEANLDDIVKVTIYMLDLEQFEEMNRVYTLFFPTREDAPNLLPARVTVQVARLPKDSLIEMDAIAVISRQRPDPEIFSG